MEQFRNSAIAAIVIAALATPATAATFDGEWNVQIASSNAACPSGTSVSIGINNGQVASNSRRDGVGPRCRSRRHSGDAGQRHEARGRLGPPQRHVRIGYVARRAVLGHLDRAADLVHIAAATRSTSDKTATAPQTAKLNPSPGNAAPEFCEARHDRQRRDQQRQQHRSDDRPFDVARARVDGDKRRHAGKRHQQRADDDDPARHLAHDGGSATSSASTIQSATVNMKLAIALPIAASPPPAENDTVESIAT